MRGLELADLQLHRHQPPQLAVVEQQVKVEIFVVDLDAFLTGDEAKARAQLQQEGFHFADDGSLQIAFLPAIPQP